MNNPPSCAVIVPTFERPGLAERAVRSALKQTHAAREIIVVDDGSTFDYGRALQLSPTVRVVRLPENRGPGAARNAGLACSTSSIVSFLDDDDELHDTFLATVAAALATSEPRVGLCWTGVTVHADNQARVWTRDFFDRIHDEESLLRAFLAIGIGHGVAVKRECLASVGGFSEDYRLVEDTEWFLRVLSHGYRPLPIRGSYVTVHCHSGPRMTDGAFFVRRRRECAQLIERMRETLVLFPFLEQMIVDAVRLSGSHPTDEQRVSAPESADAWP